MESILGWILRFYPPAFRLEFGDEFATVFRQSAAEKRAGGWRATAAWLMTELFSGLRIALRLRLNDLEQGVNMETIHLPSRDEKAPHWAIPAILAFFLVLSLPYGFYALFPEKLSFWLPFTLALLTFVVPLFVGLLTRLPRWSLLYTGIVLGGLGVAIFISSGLVIESAQVALLGRVFESDRLLGRLFYMWIHEGAIWLNIGLANGLFLVLVAFAPGLKGQRSRFWRDFSLVSFSLYGGILVLYVLAFDEFKHEELYRLASMAALGLGAWGYLRAKTAGRRTLTLLVGLTVCMASMGLGKYFLVPLQDWGLWLPNHPPGTERWLQSLQTIATWFWAMLFVGLPGMIQALRKTPTDPSPLTTA